MTRIKSRSLSLILITLLKLEAKGILFEEETRKEKEEEKETKREKGKKRKERKETRKKQLAVDPATQRIEPIEDHWPLVVDQ